MKVRGKLISAAQIIPADFDDPHPNEHHVPKMVYDPVNRVVTHPHDESQIGRVGDWILYDDNGPAGIIERAIFEERFEVVDDPDLTPPDFTNAEGIKQLSAIMSFYDPATNGVKQALCYPIIGIVLQGRRTEANKNGEPWRDFRPSEDGERWLEVGIEDLGPDVEALHERVRELQTTAAGMELLRAGKRRVEEQIALVNEWRVRQSVSGELVQNDKAPNWPQLMAAKAAFDDLILKVVG